MARHKSLPKLLKLWGATEVPNVDEGYNKP